MDAARVALCRRWAAVYRGLGYQPLPSDPRPHAEGGRKKPLCRFADWWESPAPADLFDRFETTNLQVVCGRHWRLCVLDLDGAEAVQHAEKWHLPRTWTSYHTGRGRASKHLWFSLPANLLPERRRSRLWGEWDAEKGEWKHHTAVELLCDRCLVMAPPSIHPKTGNTYGFEPGRSPFHMARPAMLPAWVWAMPSLDTPRPASTHVPVPSPPPRTARTGCKVDTAHLLSVIVDKPAVAASWGLRFAGGGSGGWLYCHDFNREDRDPSAQFNPETGVFWRPGERGISFFSLGAALGRYHDWRDCRDALAEEYKLN